MKKMFFILIFMFCGAFAFAAYASSGSAHGFSASEQSFNLQSHGSTFVAYDDDDDDDDGGDDDDGSDDEGWDNLLNN